MRHRIALDKSRLAEGILSLDWRILEQGDGSQLQIIYAGPTTNTITADCTLAGQKEVYKSAIGDQRLANQKFFQYNYQNQPSQVQHVRSSLLMVLLGFILYFLGSFFCIDL